MLSDLGVTTIERRKGDVQMGQINSQTKLSKGGGRGRRGKEQDG